MEALWDKSPTSAAEICGRFPPRAGMPAAGSLPARAYFEQLCPQHPADALVFLAHALPRREAIWWGCLCFWQTLRPAPLPPLDAVLAAALRWVRAPSEASCQAAERAAALAGDVAAGFLARAVAYCGASLTAPGLPVVAPPPFLANGTLAGALQMAAAPHGEHRLREFLLCGQDVVNGKNRWY